jgi:hypothetical protein
VVAEGRVPVASRASTHDIQYLDSAPIAEYDSTSTVP